MTATPGCGWSATSTASWLTVTSSPDGAGAGAVTYSVAPNFFANMRTGMIQVGSASFSVTQQGTTCSYVVSPAEQDFSADGGTQTVSLATGSACPWTLSSVYNWITFPAGTGGTGPAAITYTVAPNSGQLGRFGVVQVASTSFEVFQEGRFKITGVSVQGKNLIVTGTGFTDASDIIIDNVPQRTVNDPVNPTTVLVGKKSAKHIASGQTVMVEVLDHHTGNSTPPFRFTKP